MNLFGHYHTLVRAIHDTNCAHGFRREQLNEIIAMMQHERSEVGSAYASDVGYSLDGVMLVLRSCYAPHDTHIQTHRDVKRRLRLALVLLSHLADRFSYLDPVPELRDRERQPDGVMPPVRDMDDIPF